MINIPSREEIERSLKKIEEAEKYPHKRLAIICGIDDIAPMRALSQAYLAIEGMPEERIIGTDEFKCDGCGECEACKHYKERGQYEDRASNEALRFCKLVMVKKCEGLDKFLLDWGKVNSAFQKNAGFRNKLAQAIQSHLLGEKTNKES